MPHPFFRVRSTIKDERGAAATPRGPYSRAGGSRLCGAARATARRVERGGRLHLDPAGAGAPVVREQPCRVRVFGGGRVGEGGMARRGDAVCAEARGGGGPRGRRQAAARGPRHRLAPPCCPPPPMTPEGCRSFWWLHQRAAGGVLSELARAGATFPAAVAAVAAVAVSSRALVPTPRLWDALYSGVTGGGGLQGGGPVRRARERGPWVRRLRPAWSLSATRDRRRPAPVAVAVSHGGLLWIGGGGDVGGRESPWRARAFSPPCGSMRARQQRCLVGDRLVALPWTGP